jgi:hypothetical protein
MAEPLPEPPAPPVAEYPSPGPTDPEIARRNLRWGWALFGLFWLLFGGTIAVAYIYLWLS